MKPRMHHLTVVAISEVLPQDQAAYPSSSRIADLVCSCGQAFQVIDTDTPRLAPSQPRPTCFNLYDLKLKRWPWPPKEAAHGG